MNTNPLLTEHRTKVRELYDAEALPLLYAMARTGVTPDVAAAAVTYAFQQLAQRPDLTARPISPIPWLTSVARTQSQRLSLVGGQSAPAPSKAEAPDLLEALGRTPGARRRRKRPATPAAPTRQPQAD